MYVGLKKITEVIYAREQIKSKEKEKRQRLDLIERPIKYHELIRNTGKSEQHS